MNIEIWIIQHGIVIRIEHLKYRGHWLFLQSNHDHLIVTIDINGMIWEQKSSQILWDSFENRCFVINACCFKQNILLYHQAQPRHKGNDMYDSHKNRLCQRWHRHSGEVAGRLGAAHVVVSFVRCCVLKPEGKFKKPSRLPSSYLNIGFLVRL